MDTVSKLRRIEPELRLDVHRGHGLLGLLHLHHIDPPVRQVLGELRVHHQVVLVGCVRVDVGAVRRDRAELHDEREAVGRVRRPRDRVVVERAVRPARAVVLAAARADVAVGEIEPVS